MDESAPSRYIVGIDLGTTNCSCAYVDTAHEPWTVHDLRIAQLVAPGTVEARDTLPSFHYEAAQGEFPPGALKLPWSSDEPTAAVGFFARDHGATVPGRLVSSAKSWLCHNGVDRTAALLPWHSPGDVKRLSPVEVSARYLAHIRDAWNDAHPQHPLQQQDLVLTVPASFDEVARELTVEAARAAGLTRLTLVEEPQAAFYAWIDSQGERWDAQVQPGQKILVADIGGGTTDLTLIRVRPAAGGKVMFHRIAVGQHLILGGDNLDLALAHHVEEKLGAKLSPREWSMLLRSCRALKETFLSDGAPESLSISVASGSSKLIGGSRQVQLTREEAANLLIDGFLPRVGLDDKPAQRRSGFQEFALPYAPDPAITRYLAAFLSAHRDAYVDDDQTVHLHGDPARPDIVLFNGGFFASPMLQQRFLEVLSSWFGQSPRVLENDRLDLAVSRGAAYYGAVRRGRGVRIRSGLAHSYYIGVASADAARTPISTPGPSVSEGPVDAGKTGPSRSSDPAWRSDPVWRESAICLLPAGVEEGQDIHIPRPFNLLIRQPVEFPLYFSATRTTDTPGALTDVDPEQLSTLPPIRTVLQSGRKSAADEVQVELHARLTEIGTLELWAQEIKGQRRWKLDFDVRSASRADMHGHISAAELQGFVDQSIVAPARQLIARAFAPLKPGATHELRAAPTPQSLVKRLELSTAMSRHEWPASLLRSLWETLIELAEWRKAGVDHESRWLNLTGFCLRPGYGLAVDDHRVAQTWRLFDQKVQNPRNELCRAEWWVLWRRIAGGLSAGQQLTLAEPLIAAIKSRLRPAGAMPQHKDAPFQYGPHETTEVYRLLGSLELLPLPLKQSLGQALLALLPREKTAALQSASLFAIGRLGCRVPVYGPLNAMLDAETAAGWAESLMQLVDGKLKERSADALFPLVQLSRKTGDRYREVSEELRERLLGFLAARSAPAHFIELVRDGGTLESEEQKLTFGESLPRGLRIE